MCLILEDLMALSTVLAFLGSWFRGGFWNQVARPLDMQGFGDTMLGSCVWWIVFFGELRWYIVANSDLQNSSKLLQIMSNAAVTYLWSYKLLPWGNIDELVLSKRQFLHCKLFIFISVSITPTDNVFWFWFLGWIIESMHFAFLVPWQAPYPSGQNAAPTTLVYPQAPQTMNTQPQTRSPVRSPRWPHLMFFPPRSCVSLSVCVYSTCWFSGKPILLTWKHILNGKPWLSFLDTTLVG